MSIGLRADSGGNSGAVTINGTDKLSITSAGNITATTFTGSLVGNASTATALSTATGTAPVYGVRAWVNFDGTRDNTGTINPGNTLRQIKGSGNISQVLKNANGVYTISFATALPDENYALSGFSIALDASNITGASMITLYPSGYGTYLPAVKTSSEVKIMVGNPNNGVAIDAGNISIIVVR
jgi:hypothetical protein